MTIIKMFIAGAWIEGSLKQKQPIINPANEEVISYLTLADEVDLKKALNSAEIGLCE